MHLRNFYEAVSPGRPVNSTSSQREWMRHVVVARATTFSAKDRERRFHLPRTSNLLRADGNRAGWPGPPSISSAVCFPQLGRIVQRHVFIMTLVFWQQNKSAVATSGTRAAAVWRSGIPSKRAPQDSRPVQRRRSTARQSRLRGAAPPMNRIPRRDATPTWRGEGAGETGAPRGS